MTPTQIVTAQTEAFNNKELEANIALFSETFQLIQFHDNSILNDGIKSIEKMYQELFSNSPNLRAEIINRIDYGNKIILHEIIYGRYGKDEGLEQLIMYEIVKDKIEKIYRL